MAFTTHVPELEAMATELEQATKHSTNPAVKINALYALGKFNISYKGYKTAVPYFKAALELIGSSNNYNTVKAKCLSDLAVCYFTFSEKDDSTLAYLHSSLSVEGVEHDSTLLAQNYNMYSMIYYRLNDVKKAIGYGSQAIRASPSFYKKSNDYTSILLAQGTFYRMLYNQDPVKVYSDSAIFFTRLALETKKDEAADWYAMCYYDLGCEYFQLKDYAYALRLFDSASLPEYNKTAHAIPNNFSGIYYEKAMCMIQLGRFDAGKAILDTLKGINIHFRKKMYEVYYKYAEKKADWKNAFLYYKHFKSIVDSIDLEGQKTKVFEAEQKYSVAKKEADITKLAVDVLKQKEQRNMAFGAVVIVLMALLLFYFQYKRVQNKRRQAELHVQQEIRRREEELLVLEADMKVRQTDAIMAQRKKIAEDLHDDLSSSFVTLRYFIADKKNAQADKNNQRLLNDIESEITMIHENTRQYMQQLNNNVREMQYDHTTLLEDLCREISEKTALKASLEIDRQRLQLLLETEQFSQLYLIVKEAIANTLKHANATSLRIHIYFEKTKCLFNISDNGKGFAVNTLGSGIGLKSIGHRVKQLNGAVKILSDQNGTAISGSFPL